MSRRIVVEVAESQSVVGSVWLIFLCALVYMSARTLGSFVVSFRWTMITVVDIHTNSPVFTILSGASILWGGVTLVVSLKFQEKIA